MERITCEHEETKEALPIRKNGKMATLNIASCLKCRQIRKWYDSDEGEDWIAKIGRIDGKIVMPRVGQNLVVTPEESRLVREGWDQINSSTSKNPTRLRRQKAHPEQEPETIAEEPNAEMGPDLEPEQETKPVVKHEEVRPLRGTYLDQHREEILADRVIIGQIATMEKWAINAGKWNKLKELWRSEGITVVNLERGFSRQARERKEKEPAPALAPEEVTEVGDIKTNETKTVPEESEPSTKRLSFKKRLKYFEENKEAILESYRKLTLLTFYERWGLNSRIWLQLKAIWEIEPKGQLGRNYTARVSLTPHPPLPPLLPPFPPFNSEWAYPVQEEWFKTYLELKKIEK